MNRRNWLDLSRKLVDRFDLDYTINAIQAAIGEQASSYWGEGVLITRQYPDPFLITRSNTFLGGTVSEGIGYDQNGQITRIDPNPDQSPDFVCEPADPSLPRWDLLCIRYLAVGDTLVPKPSDPILTIPLNLHDDFELVVVEGTPSSSPAYPAKGDALLVVLCGFRIPAGATLGTQCTVDYSQREVAMAGIVGAPDFKQEQPTGTVNGSNKNFVLSETPLNPQSLLVMVDDLVLSASEWTLVNQTVSLVTAPAPGQTVYAYYVTNLTTSQNPLSGAQEVPSGTVDGINDTFVLAGLAMVQYSVLVFVDGMAIPITGWNLINGSNQTSIKFNPGYIPAPGQSVYVFYLVNAASFGGISATLTPETLYYTLDATDLTNKYVTLAHNPANAPSVLCEIIGNTSQIYAVDFTVSGMQLSWNGLGMDGILFTGSKLRVSYLY